MLLDVGTLFVAMFAAFSIFGITLALSRGSLQDCPEIGLLTWGAWVMLLAMVVSAARVAVPEWIAIIAGNSLLFVGVHINSQALYRFITGQGPPRWQLLLVAAGAILIAVVHQRPTAERTALASGVLVLQGMPMLWLVLTRGWHAEPALRTVALAIGIGVVGHVARIVHVLLAPAEYAAFWQPSLGNGLTYLAGAMFPLGAGIGFIVANLERVAKQLREQATYDSLTGCVRRGSFTAMLDKGYGQARRERKPLSLLLMDLDHFKLVNDTHGHHAGDQVLARFAQAVRTRMRAADVLGRMGGEEFALMLPGTDAAGALHVAEELRQTMASLDIPVGAGVPIRVTVSGGVSSLAPGADGDASALYRRADEALYASKRAGRNRMSLARERDAAAAAR
ncbi:GGDEF domain-containing protein [Aquincola sp. MAHUQ-54]|uniref:diguanylate cyclase n=1 Tax=Aquincola agrisoli TaxID=3119538 RepID=A0AAW9PZN5_9BURK